MALTQGARNKIKSFVQEIKRKLIVEFEAQLQSLYGIRPDGTCLMVEELTAKEAAVIQTAALLRGRLEYIKTTIAGKNKDAEAVAQLVREQAFTVLNRLAALRMAEERNIIRESIRKGYNSEGFLVYDQLTGGATSADQFSRYTWYLNAVFDELAVDLPAIFDRYSPYALLFPSEKVVLELLDIINDHTLVNFREEGYQLMNLWKEDETIGWVYQYYNSREEISAMREASGAPRNSRELAVRNQFFTPRYVVQFLVDNSLGQQWYEMTQGNTQLPEHCEYMVNRPKVIFLDKGVQVPEEKAEDTHYIDYRALKDPREILMLDPACGSMHFGLYCFDLYEIIYLEAWDNFPNLMRDLRDKWTRSEFVRQIPAMILRHNIHGVDIDPRAIQMAGLSLWLRAQRYYDGLNLEPKNRPSINKSNLVVAEPLPGDEKLLNDFAQSLPGPITKLLRVIWDKMKLAGETGLLLKIEEELKKEIAIAKEEWKEYKDTSSQGTLFDSPQESKVAEMAAIYGQGQKITTDFFDTAEEEVLKALETFAENAQGANVFQKLLFVEDTARGFAFIELGRKKYDVILMNPPFGSGSKNLDSYFQYNYPFWNKNILCCFINRAEQMVSSSGLIGTIYDRSANIRSTYEKFRTTSLCGKILYLADLGWNVLDANVETTCAITKNYLSGDKGFFFNLLEEKNKEKELEKNIKSPISRKRFLIDSSLFSNLPNSIIGYYIEDYIVNTFENNFNLREHKLQARKGHNFASFLHQRLFWECKDFKRVKHLYNGGSFSMFYKPYREVAFYGEDGSDIKEHKSVVLRNLSYQLQQGICYGKRGEILDAHILRDQVVFTNEGQAIPGISRNDSILLLGFLNSIFVSFVINLYCGQHKESGYVNLLPYPIADNNEFPQINLIDEIIEKKLYWIKKDETSIEYEHLLGDYAHRDNLKDVLLEFKEKLISDTLRVKSLVNHNDDFWLEKADLSKEVFLIFEKYKRKRPDEFLWFNSISLVNWEDNLSHSYEILQAIFGVIFGRWDILSILNPSLVPESNDFFAPLPFMPVVSLKEISDDYPIEIPENGILVDDINNQKDIFKSIRNCIRVIWTENADKIEEELCEIGQFESLEVFIRNCNGFFDYHFERYTESRRMAPIYWAISTPSNRFTIWIYYPKLSDQTLFRVVNDFVTPKLEQVQKQIGLFNQSNDSKEYNDQKEFLAELEDFREELLRVAQLPYRPNQDDGVLITAAPLNNLFRHTKWRKSTEDCWKKLQKGEYDWAHLAYSIWSDRVRQKCKKDLSMAIAHGLEAICEVKQKETKPKVKKGVKVDKQQKLL